MSEIRNRAEALGATVLDLVGAYIDAEGVQYQSAPVSAARSDTTERAKGVRSDPTPATALDGRRLAVRAAVVGAEQAVDRALRDLGVATRDLERATASWRGQ